VSVSPLVSVIIPCYNHGQYLHESVGSARDQSYPNIEVLVVDDGSTDNTREVCQALGVAFIHQSNQGLSAARNTGIEHSKGDYLVFLDADDWLYPGAIETNVSHLLHRPDLAFVSGWHDKVDQNKNRIKQDNQVVVNEKHFEHFLQGNYIGMHAAVMYARWIFDHYKFDTSLKACEDYDLYLNISRAHLVLNHDTKIAAYRIHRDNMSGNIPFMLEHVLKVLKSKEGLLKSEEEKNAYTNGIKIWKDYYADQFYQSLRNKYFKMEKLPTVRDEQFLLQNSVKHYLKVKQLKLKATLKKILPERAKKYLSKKGHYRSYIPTPGNVKAGDLERSTPFSRNFGYDRGGPVDRYYIENFLTENKSIIKGRVLEIGDNAYTLQFGGNQIVKSDVLHVYQANETVTFVGDLTNGSNIPDDAFDCIILTQTLHLIYDFKAALHTCYRILKPGGSLLLTVPGITHIDSGEWREHWLWAFTDKAMQKIFSEVFPTGKADIKTYGNVYIATTFLYGMSLQEVNKELLNEHDPSYQVIISVKITK
jgi:glycosyltransferase involved in cell wall biosynthesis